MTKSTSYISYENQYESEDDKGDPFPKRKYFVGAYYNEIERSFNAWLDWRETPIMNGVHSFQFKMVFSEDFKTIESGSAKFRDKEHKVMDMVQIGPGGLEYELYYDRDTFICGE